MQYGSDPPPRSASRSPVSSSEETRTNGASRNRRVRVLRGLARPLTLRSDVLLLPVLRV